MIGVTEHVVRRRSPVSSALARRDGLGQQSFEITLTRVGAVRVLSAIICVGAIPSK
jgi:hypothetical protein